MERALLLGPGDSPSSSGSAAIGVAAACEGDASTVLGSVLRISAIKHPESIEVKIIIQ